MTESDAKFAHIPSLLDDRSDTNRILFDASKELFKGPNRESLSVLAVLANYGICNEYEIGKRGSSRPTNYDLDRYVARRRITKFSCYPDYRGLKELGMVFQRDGPRHRTGQIEHDYGITLKGLMACLQKKSVRFEECYQVRKLCEAVSRWSPNNPSLVQAFLCCMKYDLALFMYSHQIHGFKLTEQKNVLPWFSSWNESNPLVKGEIYDPYSIISEEERHIIRKLQFRLITSQIVFAAIMKQLFRIKNGDLFYAFEWDPWPHEPWRNEYPWHYLQYWPTRIETIQLESENGSEPSLLPDQRSLSSASSIFNYGEAEDKAIEILQAEKYQTKISKLNIVWQGEFYDLEQMKKDTEEYLEIIEREVEDKVWSENKDKNLSPDEFRELLNKAILERIKKERSQFDLDDEALLEIEEELSKPNEP